MKTRKIMDVSPAMFAVTLEAVASYKREFTKKDIEDYTGKSGEYVRRALNTGLELGCLEQTETAFRVTQGFEADVGHNSAKDLLSKYEPFSFFCLRLSKGDEGLVAARKTRAIFKFDNTPEDILDFFSSWGKAAELLKEEENRLQLAFALTDPATDFTATNAAHEVSARAFVLESLGKFSQNLSEDERSLLTKSLLAYSLHPRNSIDDAGRALEDFLRDFSKNVGVDVSKKNGITEITNEIQNKKPAAINPKHADILRALGAMRNMATHSKDKQTEKPWVISNKFALSFSILTLRVIYSMMALASGEQEV